MINIVVENYILIGERKNPWLTDNFRFYVTIYTEKKEKVIYLYIVHTTKVVLCLPPLAVPLLPVNPQETCTPTSNLQLVFIICLVFFCHPYIAHTI